MTKVKLTVSSSSENMRICLLSRINKYYGIGVGALKIFHILRNSENNANKIEASKEPGIWLVTNFLGVGYKIRRKLIGFV